MKKRQKVILGFIKMNNRILRTYLSEILKISIKTLNCI